jgi:hypothetical protein
MGGATMQDAGMAAGHRSSFFFVVARSICMGVDLVRHDQIKKS